MFVAATITDDEDNYGLLLNCFLLLFSKDKLDFEFGGVADRSIEEDGVGIYC